MNGVETLHRMRRQEGDGGVLFWTETHKKTLIGPFRLDAGVKMKKKQILCHTTIP